MIESMFTACTYNIIFSRPKEAREVSHAAGLLRHTEVKIACSELLNEVVGCCAAFTCMLTRWDFSKGHVLLLGSYGISVDVRYSQHNIVAAVGGLVTAFVVGCDLFSRSWRRRWQWTRWLFVFVLCSAFRGNL